MTQTKKETPNIDAVFDLLTENPALLKQYPFTRPLAKK